MEVLKKLNPKAVLRSALDAIKRFPIALGLIWALMCYSVYMVHASGGDKDLFAKWAYFLATGFVLSAGLRLLSERIDSVLKSWLVRIVPLVLWGGACYWLFCLLEDRDAKDLYLPLICSMTLAVLVFFFTALFLKRDNDLQFWKFGRNVLSSLLLGGFVSTTLFAGISLFFLILKMLFDIDVNGKLYADVAIVMYSGLMPVVALSSINTKTEIDEPFTESLPKVFDRIVHFLLLGLLALYIICLYVYGLKILFTLELPKGWVSVLVSICMAGMLLVLFCVYPNKQLKTNKFDEALFKILPAVMMPLVLLMSVGIVKRFCDYGITISRLWLLIVNIWYWAVCVYLFLSKDKRIIWMPVSFGGIFLLFSFGPWSVANITGNSLRSQVLSIAGTKGYSLPLTREGEAQSDTLLVDKLRYLNKMYPKNYYQDLADSTWEYYSLWIGNDNDIESPKHFNNYHIIDSLQFDHPVSKYWNVDSYSLDLPHADNSDSVFNISIVWAGKTFNYVVPKGDLITEEKDPETMIWRNGNSIFAVSYYYLTLNPQKVSDCDNITLEGLLFEW